jgi:hypothetical protein
MALQQHGCLPDVLLKAPALCTVRRISSDLPQLPTPTLPTHLDAQGTLQYWGQALDELNMVYAVGAVLFLSVENSPGPGLKRPWLPFALILYNLAFTLVYVLLPAYFTFFVATFIVQCILVVLQSAAMYKRTSDPRLRRMFWAGMAIYACSFLFLWIPDNLFCAQIGFLNLHAWFHVTGAVAPWWYINWAVWSYYTADYASKTGMIPDHRTGKPIPAPQDILEVARNRAPLSRTPPSKPEDVAALATASSGSSGSASSASSAGVPSAAPPAGPSPRTPFAATPTPAGGAEGGDPEDTVLIIPELRWIGPRSLIVWPYVHLTRKAAFE